MTKKISQHSPASEQLFLDAYNKILTICARIELTPENKEGIRTILAQGIDFDTLIEKASWQRLHSLVAFHLLSLEFRDLVPERTRGQFRKIRLSNMARNMLLQDELARLLKIFQQASVPVVVLKGSALLGTVYEDISLRPMGDLDILVTPHHLDLAESIALQEGYQYSSTTESKKEHHHLPELFHRQKGIILEIHHNIFSHQKPINVDIQDFWHRSIELKIQNSLALAFSKEDSIIYLSLSILSDLFSHNSAVLGRLCDISEMVNRYENSLDWDLVLARSKENNLQGAICFVLYACVSLLGTSIPSGFLNKLRPTDYNTESAITFIQQRILNEEPRIVDGLASKGKAQSNLSVLLMLISRFIKALNRTPGSGRGAHEKNGDTRRSFWSKVAKVIFSPSDFKRELNADRWLFTLGNSKSTGG